MFSFRSKSRMPDAADALPGRSEPIRTAERHFVNGISADMQRWTAVLSVVTQPPRTEEKLRRNPLGIYVNGLSWSRELDTTEGARKP